MPYIQLKLHLDQFHRSYYHELLFAIDSKPFHCYEESYLLLPKSIGKQNTSIITLPL